MGAFWCCGDNKRRKATIYSLDWKTRLRLNLKDPKRQERNLLKADIVERLKQGDSPSKLLKKIRNVII